MQRALMLGFALALATSSVQAQDLRWYGGTATFQNMTWQYSGSNWGQNSISSDPRELYWGGTSSTGSKYSFNFENNMNGIEPDTYGFCIFCPAYVNLDLTPGPTIFKLGEFKHTNRPISSSGAVLNSVDLSFTLQFDANGLNSTPLSMTSTASFFIDHSETANPNGDNVVFTTPGAATFFSYNGFDYSFEVYGLKRDNSWVTTLSTPESSSRSADVYARISRVTNVPEPTSFALVAAGLVGLGGVARRRRIAI